MNEKLAQFQAEKRHGSGQEVTEESPLRETLYVLRRKTKKAQANFNTKVDETLAQAVAEVASIPTTLAGIPLRKDFLISRDLKYRPMVHTAAIVH